MNSASICDSSSICSNLYNWMSQPLQAAIFGGLVVLLVGFLSAILWRYFLRKNDPNRFRIRFAKYGAPDSHGKEVTKTLQKKVRNDRLSGKVDANLFDGFDPDPGKVKRLTVEYLIGNQLKTVEVDENNKIDIP